MEVCSGKKRNESMLKLELPARRKKGRAERRFMDAVNHQMNVCRYLLFCNYSQEHN